MFSAPSKNSSRAHERKTSLRVWLSRRALAQACFSPLICIHSTCMTRDNMYIYICTYVYMFICIYMHTCLYIRIVHAYIYIYICTHTHAHWTLHLDECAHIKAQLAVLLASRGLRIGATLSPNACARRNWMLRMHSISTSTSAWRAKIPTRPTLAHHPQYLLRMKYLRPEGQEGLSVFALEL